MNIKQAKDYIRQTVSMYLKKDDMGDYLIPVERQRPVFLLGAPGVGKTAIMEQVAQELSVALVSYSMTHHTRQSAIGLPFIKHVNYDGQDYDITEYTMSEILSTIYETMQESGIHEGILFLDEINCVSETLYPSMLQFLQYKVFGRHRVPQGWVIVTAGNPVQFNRSVREFDVAVLDRLKVMEVKPDYGVFKEYAKNYRLHPAITSFLDMKREYFYRVESTAKGRSYVTARGWEDLSQFITLMESEGEIVADELVGQYISDEEVVREFSAYYELYNKYKRDYRIGDILDGRTDEIIYDRARKAAFDERLSLLSMLIDRIQSDIRDHMIKADCMAMAGGVLRKCSDLSARELSGAMGGEIEKLRDSLLRLGRAGALSAAKEQVIKRTVNLLAGIKRGLDSEGEDFGYIREKYNLMITGLRAQSAETGRRLHNLFEFCAGAFEGGNEMLILVTELTVNEHSSAFIARYGSDDYEKYKNELMVAGRAMDLKDKTKRLIEEL